MSKFIAAAKQFVRDEEGATAVEYGLLVALIAAIIVGTVAILGGKVNAGFEAVNDELP
jgi:pilus assembly protein Flp/PilA